MSDRWEEEQERWLAGDPQPEFERNVLDDAQLTEEAYAAFELNEALVAAAPAQQRILRPGNWAWTGGLLAAVLALVIFWPGGDEPGGVFPPRLRSGGDSGAASGLAPSGALDSFPRRFTWHPAVVDSAVQYRWELYDAQARRRGVAVVSDTVLVRAAAATPDDSLGVWRWFVVELPADGREGASSAAVEFQIKPKEPR